MAVIVMLISDSYDAQWTSCQHFGSLPRLRPSLIEFNIYFATFTNSSRYLLQNNKKLKEGEEAKLRLCTSW